MLGHADVVVGTSAGSVAAAWCCSDQPLSEYMATMRRMAHDPELAEIASAIDLDLVAHVYSTLSEATGPLSASSSQTLCEIGLSVADRDDKEWYVRYTAGYLPEVDWPSNFRAVAVRASDGQVRVFGPGDGIELARAVAASAAAPGIIPGVRVGDDFYFDGGARSATNADLVIGSGTDHCLIASPIPDDTPMVGEATRRVLNEEIRMLQHQGIAVATIAPGDLEAGAFGWDLLSPGNIEPALEAGLARGRLEAGSLSSVWL